MRFSLLVLYSYILNDITIIDGAIDVDIDEGHLKREQACGKLPSKASSRISNSQESEQQFPWVIFVTRWNTFLVGSQSRMCGGTIITKTSAVSAAHCVCGPGPGDKDLNSSPEVREKIDCKGGRGNNIDANNLPNEVRQGINDIAVLAGNRNWKSSPVQDPLTKSFRIAYAYVHDQYEHKTIKNNNDPFQKGVPVDIALLKTDQNELTFYSEDSLKGQFTIGPICLPAIYWDTNLKDVFLYRGGVFESVGWGLNYEEVKNPSGPDPQVNKHSCTTNTDGPPNDIMKHCDVNYMKVNDWSCDTYTKIKKMFTFAEFLREELNLDASEYISNYKQHENIFHNYPAGYDPYDCLKLWNKADQAIRSKHLSEKFPNLHEEWENAKRIEVRDLRRLPLSYRFCYRDDLFRKHGWCYTQDGIQGKEWGFCDHSCNHMRQRDQGSKPDIYHKITWRVDNSKPTRSHCIQNPRQVDTWLLCVQSVLPDIITHSFLVNPDGSLKFLNYEKKVQSDYVPPVIAYPREHDAGYTQFCSGDSGSGSWSVNAKEERYVLVSVATTTKEPWCGSESVVIKVTDSIIHEWIVKNL